MLVSARLGVWGLEQPGSSVLEFYPAWHHMLSCHYQLFGTRAVGILACLFATVKVQFNLARTA